MSTPDDLSDDTAGQLPTTREQRWRLILGQQADGSCGALPKPLQGIDQALSAHDSIFHDPELDGPPPASPVRTFVLSADADRMLVERRIAVLGDVDLVVASSDEGPVPSQRPELEQAAGLVGRLDMTAAYLQLIGGI